MLHSELSHRLEQVQTTTKRLAQDVASGRGATESMVPVEGAVIRNGNRVSSIPETSPITEFPAWSPPGFKGIVRNKAGVHFFAAHVTAGKGEHQLDVFAVQTFDNKMLAQLLVKRSQSSSSTVPAFFERRGTPVFGPPHRQGVA
jgi:hypothetical protein